MKWQREAEYLKLTWECQRQNWSQRRNISPSFSFFRRLGRRTRGSRDTGKINRREKKVLGESCSTNPKEKDLTESPFDYAQQSSSSQKRTIAMTSKTLPQLSWSSTQKNSKTSLKCMKLRRLQIPPTTELVINTKNFKDIFKMHETEKVAQQMSERRLRPY